MNYLAINTAVGAEILLSLSGTAYYYRFPHKIMAGGLILPAVNDLLEQAKIKLESLDAFVCVTGPGSFTGIRIGVATVRAFAYALNKPVIGVTYFDLLAYNSTAQWFTAAVDGGAGVAYLQNFDAENRPPFAVKMQDVLKYAHKNIVIDPFFGYDLSQDVGAATIRVLQGDQNPLKAAAESAIAQNKFISYNDLIPIYLRRSQPEREAGEI